MACSPPEVFDMQQVRWIVDSYRHWLGADLLVPLPNVSVWASALWSASRVVVSHGVEPDPVFNYGNRAALERFGYSWDQFTRLPSRYSAEPLNRDERSRVLDDVRRQGFSCGYQGVRIAANGQKFRIHSAVVWNLIDDSGHYRGQAACFAEWTDLP